ncbi:hypothetical protein H0H81_011757 [Sphagnurus paluster]|uniref:Uncharacterized protein n=1 Tax=Sphagnurus paluster TaxID=117069 RepID=A0A9P7FS81_9AGAR|nr:hypothetical protein H0H81_011757 [Sphagnurus paluster]
MEERDLVALSTVSSDFQHHAEAVLYAVVNLTHSSCHWNRVISWCRVISSTPRKAKSVRALKFPSNSKDLPPSLAGSLDEIDEIFRAAFASISNLRHLFFSAIDNRFAPTVKLSTLSDCRFRLSSLSDETTALLGPDMELFLSTQPDIVFWSPTQNFLDSCSSPLPEMALPRLRTLFIPDATKLSLVEGRPVEYLFLSTRGSIQSSEHLAGLRNISETLHTLYYVNFSVKLSDTDLISCLAKNAPGIVSLTIACYHSRRSVPREEQEKLVDAAASLPRLKTLVLSAPLEVLSDSPPAEPDSEDPAQRSIEWIEVLAGPKLNRRQCLRVAGAFMRACRSLTRLSVPAGAQGGIVTFVRSDTNSDRVVLDGSYNLEGPGWWKAYNIREVRGGS